MLGAVYILLGMGIIAMCVNLMQEKIITEVILVFISKEKSDPVEIPQVRLLVRSLGLIREFRDVDEEEL